MHEKLNQKIEELERTKQENNESKTEISVLIQKIEQLKAEKESTVPSAQTEIEKLQKEIQGLKSTIEQNDKTIRRLMDQNIKFAQVIFSFKFYNE